jgi:MFS family permease
MSAAHGQRRLSPNVAMLGCVSMLTAMSSSMIYSLLPIFLMKVLGASVASVGLIEGLAEAANSLIKVFSGAASDRVGRRKPLVVLGYLISALVKTLFPLAGTASVVLAARVTDRLGKGIRDAPRDAFLADLTAPEIRGSGFGLHLALAFGGFVLGPLLAMAVMQLSAHDFRLVFWLALIPAYLSIIVLIFAVHESAFDHVPERRQPIRLRDLTTLPAPFWWAMTIASLLALARVSPAFLVLKAHEIGMNAAVVPIMLVVLYLVYSITAYPFGVLADRVDRRLQLGVGVLTLICADLVLVVAEGVWMTVLGAALWGLQLGVTQGLLRAAVADAAPVRLRGTAFGLYDVAIGVATFAASAGAGLLWALAGPAAAFALGAAVAAAAALMLAHRPLKAVPAEE